MVAGRHAGRGRAAGPGPAGFIEAPAAAGDGEPVTGAWRWARLPEPDLSEQPAHVQSWELTRFQAYEQWLADMTVGRVFERAAGFLNLAARRPGSVVSGRGWLGGAADGLLGGGHDLALARDLFQAAAGRFGQHQREQRAEGGDACGEQQGAAQPQRTLQDGEQEHA